MCALRPAGLLRRPDRAGGDRHRPRHRRRSRRRVEASRERHV